jgi:hypothetical protein
MAIDRKNSFHLLLSDDEAKLLKLLAEREGLNASDYLRTLLRRMASTPPRIAEVLRVSELLGVKVPAMTALANATGTATAAKRKRVKK